MGRPLRLLVAALLLALVASGFTSRSSSPRLVTVVRGLESPVFVTQAPGEPGRLYVVEQVGRIRVVEKGRLRPAPLLDVSRVITAGGEQGLLGLAFAPDYARSGRFFVNYSDAAGATVIARYRVVRGKVVSGSRRQLLRVPQPYANHNGGHLAFGPDGKLWVGLGDGGAGGDPENRAQDPGTLLGKLFRLDVTKASPTPEVVGLGLRNPWRYSFDRKTGDLWIGDVGQGAIEEIDVLRRGTTGLVNFGWDVYEGSRTFESKALGPGRLIQPVAEYSHAEGCSVTGGYVFRGVGVPRLAGRYVFGDYCSGTIWSMPATGGSPRVEPVEVEGLTSFGEGLKGELYAVSGETGTIFRFAR